MSNFTNKFDSFTGNSWSDELEVALNNELIKNKSKILSDESKGAAFLDQFMALNSKLIDLTSPTFNDKFNELRASLNEEYNGYWEQTALEVYNVKNKRITPEEIKAIKEIGRTQFNTIIREVEGNMLYVPKMDISNIKSFEDEIKGLNKLLKTRLTTNPKYNIANKVNKEQEKLNKLKDQEQNALEIIQAENRKQFMNKPQPATMGESKNIKELYDITVSALNESKKGFNSDALLSFISKNRNKIESICENYDSNIDGHRLVALLENDTSDINIYDVAATSYDMKKRVEKFDPYKNVANKSAQSGKTIVSFDGKQLKEAINRLNIPKILVIGTDIDSTEKYSNVIIECEGKKENLVISQAHFSKFLVENAAVSNYMKEGKLELSRYLSSRPRGFVSVLFQEYFNKYKSVKKAINESTDFKIDDVDFDKQRAEIVVRYYYDADNESRELKIPFDTFSDWLENDPERHGYQHYLEKDLAGHDWYNFFNFVNDLDINQKYNLMRDYILSTKLISESTFLKEVAMKDEYPDYNSWKEQIATRTNNNYEIKRKSTDSLNSAAYNSAGKLLGEWMPNENKGIIYK